MATFMMDQDAPFSPPLQEYDQEYTPPTLSQPRFDNKDSLFPVPVNGLPTPAPSPLKRKPTKSSSSSPPKRDLSNVILPPFSKPANNNSTDMMATAALKKSTPASSTKKQERQAKISEMMKAGKPTGKPRGRPRKNPLPVVNTSSDMLSAPKAAKEIIATSNEQNETVKDKKRLSNATSSPRKKQKAIEEPTPVVFTLDKAVSMANYEPFGSRWNDQLSPHWSTTSPSIACASPTMAYSLQIDSRSGEACLQTSLSSASIASDASTVSSASTMSTRATSIYSDSAPLYMKQAPIKHRKMTAAVVPGMGRVLFERSVLVDRLGLDGASQAISMAIAAGARRASISGLSDSSDVLPLRLPGGRAKEEQLRRWLEAEWENDDDGRAAAFQPREGSEALETLAPSALTVKPLADDEEMPFIQQQEVEEFVMQQGGKSLRLLKRRKPVDEEATPLSSPILLPGIETLGTPVSLITKRTTRPTSPQESIGCICNNQTLDDQGMVQCDSCRGWYHLHCLGIEDADDLPETYFCVRCAARPVLSNPFAYANDPILNSSLMAREPTLVHSSPRITRSIQGFASNLDYALAPSPMPNNVHPNPMMHTPAVGSSRPRLNASTRRGRRSSEHIRQPSQAWVEQTPEMTRSATTDMTDLSFSPRTPAMSRLRNHRGSLIDSIEYDSDGEREYAVWDVMLQTPSRNVEVAHDWSNAYDVQTPHRRRSSFHHFPGAMFNTPHQEVVHHGYSQQKIYQYPTEEAFEQPVHHDNGPHVRFVEPSYSMMEPSASEMRSKAETIFNRVAPSMAKTNSGLGIGFGDMPSSFSGY